MKKVNKVLLNINNLMVSYGQVLALKEISLSVKENEIVALVGANGAGKTTLLKTITGLIKSIDGEIWYNKNVRIDGMPPHNIVKYGISLVPENRGIFSDMTVYHNLKIGAFHRNNRNEVNKDLEKTYDIFPILKERKKQLGGSLSGGEQQMLAIGRALMSKPKLLLLDEPSLGLSPLMIGEVAKTILNINKHERVSVLLVEQNAKLALQISNKGYVLENGNIVHSGESKDLLKSNVIKKAYLGGN